MLTHFDEDPLFVNFAAADYSVDGDVMIVFMRGNREPFRTEVRAVRYDAASDSWSSAIIHANVGGPTQEAAVSYRPDGSAVAIHRDVNQCCMSSRTFRNAWSPGIETVTSDVLASIESAANGMDISLIYQTTEDVFGTRLPGALH